MKTPRKILIIKTGFSEFLDRGISTTVSLGDVLICTSILHLYASDDVTWVTDWQARQLLEGNPYIKRLLIFGTGAWEHIRSNEYDVLVNLEKDSGICVFLNGVPAKEKYGFYFDDAIHGIATRGPSSQYLLAGQENHRDIDKNALEILFESVGAQWEGQGLILPLRQPAVASVDIGFNHAVGSKWPTKAWPMPHWKALEKILSSEFSISWQQGHEDLVRYIDWINSCKVIVTSDSLGQAIGQALGKQVITLYGPTNYLRMKGVPGVSVLPSKLDCPQMPCFLPNCTYKEFCMDHILPQQVAQLCKEQFKCKAC